MMMITLLAIYIVLHNLHSAKKFRETVQVEPAASVYDNRESSLNQGESLRYHGISRQFADSF